MENESRVPESHQGPQPKDWLVESILVTILCCLPFGLAGIVNAAKVKDRYRLGDYDGAERASNEAKKWTLIGLGVGLLFILLYTLIVGLSTIPAIMDAGF